MTTTTENTFLDLVAHALRITQDPQWLDPIIEDHYLVGFPKAPGLFVVAHKKATPRQLAVLLAIRQVERDAYQCFSMGAQAQAERAEHGGLLQ